MALSPPRSTEPLWDVCALMQEELDLNRPLLASGDVSRTELIRLERQVAEITAEITNARTAFFREVQGELSEVQSELSSVMQQMRQRNNVLEQTILYAPLRGIVKNLEVTTIGGVVRPGGTVMEIVPVGDDLLIEGKVKPSDIAFLHLGQAASVKVDAYDFSIYGHLPGELVFISADTMVEQEGSRDEEPYYRVRIRTGRRFSGLPDRQLEILPGMTATVEIKTGRRTVMQYLTKPIIKPWMNH